ncbi:MAG: tetratricopeptide repeat protein [Gammaproteobacteria bacterium]
MDANETDEQRLEHIKAWWKENASSVITGLLLGLALLFGAKSWFAYQDRKADEASNIYATLMNALSRGEESLVNDRAGVLIGEYSSTPYATLAALALAKVKLEQGVPEAAHAQLQWALDKSGSEALRPLVRLRLARVMVAEGNLEGAEALLAQSPTDSAFAPLVNELQGDIHAARGAVDEARAEYEIALAALPPESAEYRLLQLKYENTEPSALPDDGK